MAKSKGLIQFEGTLGSLIAYELNGKLVIKRKPEFDKEQRDKDNNFQPQRNNNKEFGAAAMLSKYIRNQLAPLWGTSKQAKLNNLLTQHFLKLIKASDGPHGQRTPNWSLAPEYLEGLNLAEGAPVDRFLTHPLDISNEANSTKFQLKGKFTALPKACSHLNLKVLTLSLPELTFDKKSNNYLFKEPSSPVQPSLLLQPKEWQHIALATDLNTLPALILDGNDLVANRLVILQLQCLQKINNTYNELNTQHLSIYKALIPNF